MADTSVDVLKLTALEKALELHNGGLTFSGVELTAEKLIENARKIEAYLRGADGPKKV